MCGAAFLVRHELSGSNKDEGGKGAKVSEKLQLDEQKKALLVVDLGGTTTDVGMLLASGLPRQAAAFTDVAGIRMNFSCPDVKRYVLISVQLTCRLHADYVCIVSV
jgi:hypothetical protein